MDERTRRELTRDREPDSWRGTDHGDYPESDDTLENPRDYPDKPMGGHADDRTCKDCDTRVPPHRQYCQLCGPTEIPSAEINRGSKSAGRDSGSNASFELTLDRVVATVVDAPSKTPAVPVAEIAIGKRADDTTSQAVDTSFTPIRDFDGEPPYPIGREYDELPAIARTDSEAGQQLLADLAADIQDADDDRPQLYDEYGEPITDWETAEDLQSRFAEAERWIVTAVVRQKIPTSSDDQRSQLRDCVGRCRKTTHKFTGDNPDGAVMPNVWKCTRCGAAHPPDQHDDDVDYERVDPDLRRADAKEHEKHMRRLLDNDGARDDSNGEASEPTE